MAPARTRPSNHLRIVHSDQPSNLPELMSDPVGRKQVQELTQQLVDVLIEMMDLVDGDPNIEPNGDESEDSDGF